MSKSIEMYIIIPNSYREILKGNKIEKAVWWKDGKIEKLTQKMKEIKFSTKDLLYNPFCRFKDLITQSYSNLNVLLKHKVVCLSWSSCFRNVLAH